MDTFFDIEAQERSRVTKLGAQTQHRVVLRLVPPSASKQSEIVCARDKCVVFHNIGKAISGSTELAYICSKAYSWRDVIFCLQECSLPTKSALSFAAVTFREISSTAALMELLLPIEIHVAVCELQATHRPIIAGLLVENCAIQV